MAAGTRQLRDERQVAVRGRTAAAPRRMLGSYGRQLGLALALAVAARLWVLVSSHGMLDGDEAVLGIQAEDILRGAHPIYFSGQPYMGSWDAYLLAPIVALFGPSAYAVHALTLAESLPLVPLLGALASRLYGEGARVPALLLAALPPLYVSVTELRMLGGYVETLVLGTTLLLVVVSIADRWQQGRATTGLWLLAGVLSGLGLWIDILVGYYLVAGALWLAPLAVARVRRARVTTSGARLIRTIGVSASVAVAGGVVGFAPALAYALGHHFTNVTIYFLPANSFAAKHPLRLGVLRTLLTVTGPRVAGMRTVWDATPLAHHIALVLGLIAAVVTAAAIGYSALALVQRRPRGAQWLDLNARETRGFWRWALAPLLACVIVGVFWRSSATGNVALDTGIAGIDLAGRYALPLTTALSLMLAALASGARSAGRGLSRTPAYVPGRQRASARLMAAAGLAALLALYAVPYLDSNAVAAMQTSYRGRLTFPAEHADMMTHIERHHITAIWTTHWIGNVLMYFEAERVTCADYVDVRFGAGHDRFPQKTAAVAAANRASFIIEADPALGEPETERALDALGVRYTSVHFGTLWVITPLSRTVQPDEIAAALRSDY